MGQKRGKGLLDATDIVIVQTDGGSFVFARYDGFRIIRVETAGHGFPGGNSGGGGKGPRPTMPKLPICVFRACLLNSL
jgi:hypothetical protein